MKVLKIIESKDSSLLTDKLTEDEKSDLFGGIESEGLGYWCQNYGYKGDNDDELVELCKKGKEVLNKLQNRLRALGVEV